MLVRVLGAGAGGGFPQWNAGSAACERARAGDPAARSTTQASVALSNNGQRWALVNASPDLRQQIGASPFLWPTGRVRSSPIAAVVLTNGDVDAVAGLLHLREGTPFAIYGHRKVLETLEANPIFEVVTRELVPRRHLELEQPTELTDAAGVALGIRLTPFAAPGKVPLYREREMQGPLETAALAGDVIGLEIETGSGRLVYLANCASITDAVRQRTQGAAWLFMDGTLWRDDEMIEQGVGTKTGARMGHVAMSGPEGAIARLSDLTIGQRMFIHINNTNPALLADSSERALLEARGWQVAHDGMEFEL
jgi:pyrroloquinoline quinone biosynthesis protein B